MQRKKLMKKGIGISLAVMMSVSMVIPVSAAEEANIPGLTNEAQEQVTTENTTEEENTNQIQTETEEKASSEEATEEEKNQSEAESVENADMSEAEKNDSIQAESPGQAQENQEESKEQPEVKSEEENEISEQSLESRAANSFRIEGTVLKKYTGTGGAVTIPSYITEIDNWAFANAGGITSVKIPSSVKKLDIVHLADAMEW